jgi:hypothetical protein
VCTSYNLLSSFVKQENKIAAVFQNVLVGYKRIFRACQWENVKEILLAKMTSNHKHDLASLIRVDQKWIVVNNFATLP